MDFVFIYQSIAKTTDMATPDQVVMMDMEGLALVFIGMLLTQLSVKSKSKTKISNTQPQIKMIGAFRTDAKSRGSFFFPISKLVAQDFSTSALPLMPFTET